MVLCSWAAACSTVDLDIAGDYNETTEDNPGAVAVRRYDGNDAPRKEIILQKPTGYGGNVTLTRSNTKVKVFTAAEEGTEITFNGADNKFAPADLPKHLFVQGDIASGQMRDVTLTLTMDGPPGMSDSVTFTVLWVTVAWKRASTDNVSDENSRKGNYETANDDGGDEDSKLAMHNYTAPKEGATRGWGYEIMGTVEPPDFTDPIGWFQDCQSRPYGGPAPDGNIIVVADEKNWTETWPKARNDGPADEWQDKVVGADHMVFFLDFPRITRTTASQNFMKRYRANFKVVAVYTGHGYTDQQCSSEWKHYVRFSCLQADSPNGARWVDVDNIEEDDGKAESGTHTKLSWNLKSPAATGIAPNSGTNNGAVNITNLAGTSFVSGAKVKLTKSGEADIVGTNVSLDSVSKITCTFDLTGKATGQWNVVVINPADESNPGTLTNGFTINAP
jgi:hypothetical protein